MLKQSHAKNAPFWPQRTGAEYVNKFIDMGHTARALDGSEKDENTDPDRVVFRKSPPPALSESRAVRVHQRATAGTPRTETLNHQQSYLEPDVFEADLVTDTFKLTRTLKSETENPWGGMISNYELYTEFRKAGPEIAVTEGTRLIESYPEAEQGWERQFTVNSTTGAITSLDPFADDWFSGR